MICTEILSCAFLHINLECHEWLNFFFKGIPQLLVLVSLDGQGYIAIHCL